MADFTIENPHTTDEYISTVNFTDIPEQPSVATETELADGSKDGTLSCNAGEIPLQTLRPGYLWVSDLTRQNWCEQQLVYSLTVSTVQEVDPVQAKGTDLHLTRELAVHDKISVSVTSSEDIWAIKVLNLWTAVQSFFCGKSVAREVPIFGLGFDQNIFFVGMIDELRFDLEEYSVSLVELKTRKSRSLPPSAQEQQHKLQVWMYKKLFDDLVKGKLKKETIAKHLRLSLKAEFGEEIQEHIEQCGLACKTLDSLLSNVLDRVQAMSCIGALYIEYVHQDTGESFSHKSVDYEEEHFTALYFHYIAFWLGQRSCIGVDIEEAWKCNRCDFEAICKWRKSKTEECQQKNKLLKNAAKNNFH